MHHREGSALNLARVAAMVQGFGGGIAARSEGPGRGATFVVELPGVPASDSHHVRRHPRSPRRARPPVPATTSTAWRR